jgi:uncharacterized membrane protein
MTKGRLEAYSDGVIAILITIMVLELHVPHETTWEALSELAPIFVAYLLSFVFVGIYWGNHHHLLHAAHRVNGRILWANQALLFSLSLVPFATAWMGENRGAVLPTAVYGGVMVAAAITFTVLSFEIVREHGQDSPLGKALSAGGRSRKGNASLALYTASIPLAWVSPWISQAIFAAVALMWLVPDREIEAQLHEAEQAGKHGKKD